MFKKSKCAFAAKLGVTMLLSMTSISLFPNLVKDAGIVYASNVVKSSNINKFLTITTDDHNRICSVYLNVPKRYDQIDKNALQNLPQDIKNNLKTVHLNGIEEVPDGLFSNLPTLESVAIGDKCTKIGESAFFNCQNLNKVELGKNCAVIGKLAFSNCKNLNKIKLGENCAVIEDSAFAGCSALRFVKFPENLKSVGDRSFFGTDIRWLKLAKCNKLESLGPFCFSACPKLYKVDLPENGNLQTIGGYCFSRCPIEKIAIPKSATFLGGHCFCSCAELVDVAFAADSQLDCLRMETFSNCKKLKNVNIPGSVCKISINCFKNCIELESLFLPEKVSEMGENCFEGDLKLTKVNLPQNINPDNIGAGLFKGCSSLENIELPKSWKALPREIFMDCKNLKRIDLGEIQDLKYGCFYGSGISEIVIPGSVNNIGSDCFKYCNRLKRVDLSSFNPEKLGQRTDALFSGCERLEEVVLPENLKVLPKNMFSNSGIKKIVIPSSVEQIGNNCFGSCNRLEEFDLALPDNKDLEFGIGLFENCGNLKKAVLPKSLKVLPRKTFSNCKKVTKVNLNKIENLEESCLAGTGIVAIDLSNVKSVGCGAFSDSDIKYLFIPKNVESIGKGALQNCKSLERVKIDKESEASIGSDCFRNTSLKNFVVPANCHIDGVGVFAGDKNLNFFEHLGNKICFNGDFFVGNRNLIAISCPNMEEFKYRLSAFGGVGENARIYFPPAGKIEQLD